jgi:Na+-driven multidrug efflux pump
LKVSSGTNPSPRFGGHGAAAATSIALVFETVLLFWITRRRLGLHVLAFGKRTTPAATS